MVNMFLRLMRAREFGLDKHWLVTVDLEHRENERRKNESLKMVFLNIIILQVFIYLLGTTPFCSSML